MDRKTYEALRDVLDRAWLDADCDKEIDEQEQKENIATVNAWMEEVKDKIKD